MSADVLIAGGGIFGITAAIAFKQRGLAVALYDPGPLPHPLAESTDISKVVRMDYGPDEDYLALMEDAMEGWRRYNARWPRPLYHETGVAFGRELGRAAGLRPVKKLEAGFERLCEAVRSLGYQASLEQVDSTGAVIASPTCPLRPLVRARREAVEIDRGMWAGLAACAVSGVDVRRVRCETR